MIYPFTLIDSLAALVPKVKQLILTTPPEIEELIKQKIKKKFHYAAALSIPKPNLDAAKAAASSAAAVAKSAASSAASAAQGAASSVASGSVPVKIEQSQPPPAASNIPETPSVPEIEPAAPVKEHEPKFSTFNITIYRSSVKVRTDFSAGYYIKVEETKMNPASRSSITLADEIERKVEEEGHIKYTGKYTNFYVWSNPSEPMTLKQARIYFDKLFGDLWYSDLTLHFVKGSSVLKTALTKPGTETTDVSLVRPVDITVFEDPYATSEDAPADVLVKYEQYGDELDEDGESLEDGYYDFPDGFLTV